MRHYVRSSLGVDTPVPATEQAPIEPVSARTPDFTRQALSVMAMSALPWLPVAAGAWVGDKYDRKGWGALAGFAVSFLSIRYIAKQGVW